jgi:DNA-binding GntR family transcriptional regulator
LTLNSGLKGALSQRSRSLSDLAHEEIQRRIANGTLQPGSRVVIGALAAEFGMSLIPVREALARLHAERLVTSEANKGYRVSSPPDSLELGEMFAARLMLECGGLEVSVGRVGHQDFEELHKLNETMARATYGTTFDGYIDFVKLNAAFHERLIAITGNAFFLTAYRQLGYEARITQTLHGRGVPDIDRLVAEHAQIVTALEEGSLERARAALRSHILDGARRLGALIDWQS